MTRSLTLLFLLFVFSQVVFAGDYYWSNPFAPSPTFSNALDACRFSDGKVYSTPGSRLEYHNMVSVGTVAYPKYNCYYNAYNANGTLAYSNKYIGYTSRSGTGCTLPNLYDPVTQSCVAPAPDLCKDAQGASTSYTVKTTVGAQPPTTIDVNGCLATFGGVIVCGNNTKGEATCTGTATITGEKTTASAPIAGEGVECSGDACLQDAPKPATEEQPCTLTVDPNTGLKSCLSSSSSEKPGTTKCGQANGTWICTEQPKSELVKKETQTTIEETSNIDGSIDQTKTDKTNVTICKGVNNCTTKTSETVSQGGTNPDGSPKGTSSTCVGDSCKTPGSIGDEVAETEEEEPPAPPTINPLTKPTEKGNFDDAAAEWDEKIQDARDELKTKSKEIGELFTPVAQLNLAAGSASLPCTESFDVMGQTTSICLGKYESQLTPLAMAILFICALIALFIIFKPGD